MSFLPVGWAAQRPPSPRRLRPSQAISHIPGVYSSLMQQFLRHGAHITTSLCTRQPAALPPQHPLSAFILRYQNYYLSSTCKRGLPTPIGTPPAVRADTVLDTHSFHSLLSNALAPSPAHVQRPTPPLVPIPHRRYSLYLVFQKYHKRGAGLCPAPRHIALPRRPPCDIPVKALGKRDQRLPSTS